MPIDGGPIEQLIVGAHRRRRHHGVESGAQRGSPPGRLVFSVFEDDGHAIYVLDPDRRRRAGAAARQRTRRRCCPGDRCAGGDVAALLADYARGLPAATARPRRRSRTGRKLTLDAIGQPTHRRRQPARRARRRQRVGLLQRHARRPRRSASQAQVGGSLRGLRRPARLRQPPAPLELGGVGRRSRRTASATSRDADDPATGEIAIVSEVIERQTSRGVSRRDRVSVQAVDAVRSVTAARRRSRSRGRSGRRRTTADDAAPDRTSRERELTMADPLYLAQAERGARARHVVLRRDRPDLRRAVAARARAEHRHAAVLDGRSLDWRRYFMPRAAVHDRGARRCTSAATAATASIRSWSICIVGHPEFVHGYGVGSFDAGRVPATASVGAECEVFNNLVGSRMAVGQLRSARAARRACSRASSSTAGCRSTSPPSSTPASPGRARLEPSFAGGDRDSRPQRRRRRPRQRLRPPGRSKSPPRARFDRVDRGLQWQVGMTAGILRTVRRQYEVRRTTECLVEH